MVKSLICEGGGRVSVAEVPDPEPRHGEALVRIEASAVCGSERGTLMDGADGNTGHEACGIVVDPGLSTFQAGDRVGLSAVVGCGVCDRCIAGQELYCRAGATAIGGWHGEYAAVAASALRALPTGAGAGDGALITGDALGVPARGLHRAPSAPGDRVLVIGLGPIGLGHVLVRAFAGAEVVAIEPSEYRRELALQLGATAVYPPGTDIDFRPRLVVECSGRPACIEQAFAVVEDGGTVLQSGGCSTEIPIHPSKTFIRREITYTGSWYYATEDYQDMCDLWTNGLPLARMCTHEVAATDAQTAITDFLGGNSGKILIRWA